MKEELRAHEKNYLLVNGSSLSMARNSSVRFYSPDFMNAFGWALAEQPEFRTLN
jgi:hypothetical protein